MTETMESKYDTVMKSKPDEALVKIVFIERDFYDADAVISACTRNTVIVIGDEK